MHIAKKSKNKIWKMNAERLECDFIKTGRQYKSARKNTEVTFQYTTQVYKAWKTIFRNHYMVVTKGKFWLTYSNFIKKN